MPPDSTETERGITHRIPAAEHPTGHDLLAIDAWLPGTRPSEYAIELTTGPTYHARYWRCRACGEERSRPDDFDSVCSGMPPEPVVTDGGSSDPVRRTRPDPETGLSVDFLTFGPGYRVHGPDGDTTIVDIEARTCRCLDASDVDRACAHLERADEALRTGELPGPDGQYVQ